MDPVLALMLFLTATYAVGFVGSQATLRGLGFWYITLNKPSWNPPPWVFAPVWTTLYALMGTATWLVWKQETVQNKRPAYILYSVQLFLNGLWSWLFFGFQKIDLALYEIVVMLVVIIITTISFGRIKALAGWLMAPYILWVSIATALNFTLFRMNP